MPTHSHGGQTQADLGHHHDMPLTVGIHGNFPGLNVAINPANGGTCAPGSYGLGIDNCGSVQVPDNSQPANNYFQPLKTQTGNDFVTSTDHVHQHGINQKVPAIPSKYPTDFSDAIYY